MIWIINLLSFAGAFIFMECFAWCIHKYVMHGWGWFLHKSHHTPHKGKFELNDLYGLIFAFPAIILIYYGLPVFSWMFWVGLGITAYGLCYYLFHDVYVHRRLKHNVRSKNNYLNSITRAHKIHHKSLSKDNASAFGFLFAHPMHYKTTYQKKEKLPFKK